MGKSAIGNALIAALGVLTSVAIAHGGFQLVSKQASVTVSSENVEACRELSTRIKSLRSEAASASLRQQTSGELTSKLEKAADSSRIAMADLIRINPQQPRRAGKTAYLQEVTDVDLRRVSMQQLVSFLLSAISDDPAMYVSSIRITAPRNLGEAGGNEVWDAEISLTRLVFSPQSARST